MFELWVVIVCTIILFQTNLKNRSQVLSDIKNLINSSSERFTGRAIARILHGIQSPNYPATIWGLNRYWRSHMQEDFNAISKLATEELTSIM